MPGSYGDPVLPRCLSAPGAEHSFHPGSTVTQVSNKTAQPGTEGAALKFMLRLPHVSETKASDAQLPGSYLSWGLWRTFSDTGSVSSHWYFCLSLRRDIPGKERACGLCALCLHRVSGRKEWKNKVLLVKRSSGKAEKGFRIWPAVPLERLYLKKKKKFKFPSCTKHLQFGKNPPPTPGLCPPSLEASCLHEGTCPQHLFEARLALRARNAMGEGEEKSS